MKFQAFPVLRFFYSQFVFLVYAPDFVGLCVLLPARLYELSFHFFLTRLLECAPPKEAARLF